MPMRDSGRYFIHRVVSSNDAFRRRLLGSNQEVCSNLASQERRLTDTSKCSPAQSTPPILFEMRSRSLCVWREKCGSLKRTIRHGFQSAVGPGRIVSHRQVVGQASVRHLHFAGRIRTKLNLRGPRRRFAATAPTLSQLRLLVNPFWLRASLTKASFTHGAETTFGPERIRVRQSFSIHSGWHHTRSQR
jgi:hypothetical protein